MAHLLHIDTSPRGDRSRSRRFSREFVEAWKHHHPGDIVTYRDIGHDPIPHIDEPWIAAAYTPSDQRALELQQAIQLSDRLVDELLAADIYVLGVPMYNFSIPSGLKAYIDQIVRIGRTFNLKLENPENPYEPLVLGKQMFIITARGTSGYGAGEPYEAMNFQDPYLKTVFGFIGITDVSFIHVENDELGGDGLAQSIATAQTQIAELTGV